MIDLDAKVDERIQPQPSDLFDYTEVAHIIPFALRKFDEGNKQEVSLSTLHLDKYS
jgi:hypothetical protein